MKDLQIHINEDKKGQKRNSRMERCVLCGRILNVSVDLPISERKTYVETSGQLCEECCWEVYGTNWLQTNEN